MRRLALLIAVAASLTGASPALAYHPDPAAPRGAPPYWLPEERWVDARWLPFEEARLLTELDLSYRQFLTILRAERPLAAVARRRGVPPSRLTAKLLGWRGRTGTPVTVLWSRTARVLTQPHLAAHMFTHSFHNSAIRRAAPSIFGISPERYLSEISTELVCPLDIARRRGRSRRTVQERTLAALRARNDLGVRRGAMPASQAAAFDFAARLAFDDWLVRNVHGKPLP